MQTVRIRPVTDDDRSFILGLIPRLVEFGPPAWRDAAQMTATDARKVAAALDARNPDTAVFVAEDRGERLGFIELWTLVDYFSGERHGHVSNIVVAGGAEGRGVGGALLAAGEAWCRDHGYRMLTLHVFEHNRDARALYERCGFAVDTIRYVKTV
jgi:ribosomal protein S18 acetylase RimI-like enzyme